MTAADEAAWIAETELPSAEEVLAPLLGEDWNAWREALAGLRADPEQGRELLLLAAETFAPAPGRWRLFHHLVEFGRAEDISFLLARLDDLEDGRERAALLGAVRAQYSPSHAVAELGLSVVEFSYLLTQRLGRVSDRDAGRFPLSPDVFRAYHRESVPIDVIKRLLPLRGKAYGSREDAGEAFAARLKAPDWREFGDTLLAPLARRPRREAQEGTLRLTFRNPLARPVLLRVEFDAWFATFDPPPAPRHVYLEAAGESLLDVPVRLVKPQEAAAPRLDVRMWEVNGPFIPLFRKLYLAG